MKVAAGEKVKIISKTNILPLNAPPILLLPKLAVEGVHSVQTVQWCITIQDRFKGSCGNLPLPPRVQLCLH